MTTSKYVTENGIRKYRNPSLAPAQPLHGGGLFVNQSTALPVVSAPLKDEEIVVTETYQQAVTQYHDTVEPEIFIKPESDQPTTGGGGLDELNQVLAKYEVPGGMLTKLLLISEFEVAEIIVDDSGSMNASTDAKGPLGESLTRWMEAKLRISQMMELLAYCVSPVVYVRFLNRTTVLELERASSENPKDYIQRIENSLNDEFDSLPSGTTPAWKAIQESLFRYQGQAVLRYFMGDGVPNGGEGSCRAIEQALINRSNPERNPFTFMSCTNNDQDTEWMKECEEKAAYCSEFDDYQDESHEIIKDQGAAFPYSFGLYLVGLLVAAFCPDDLDAIDESVPFSRQTLENLLGYKVSPEEYKYYFDSFVTAQENLQQTPSQSRFIQKLPLLFEQFESTALAKDISAVADYKRSLVSETQAQQSLVGGQYQQRDVGQEPECCVLL